MMLSINNPIPHVDHIATCLSKIRVLKRRKTKIKKWFDTDLGKLRARVVSQGILYSIYPQDPIVRRHYYKLYREYNKLRKMKYR